MINSIQIKLKIDIRNKMMNSFAYLCKLSKISGAKK